MTVTGIERRVDAGADANFENAIAGGDDHPLAGVQAARMQGRAERQVVDAGEPFIDALDEIALNGCDRECAGRDIGPELGFVSLEQRHALAPPV